MSAVLAFSRLLFRRQGLQSLLFVMAMALGTLVCEPIFLRGLPWRASEAVGNGLFLSSLDGLVVSAHSMALLVVVGPVSLGILCGEAVVQVLVCPFSFLLPDLRRRLRLAIFGAGALVAVGAGAGFAANGGPQPGLPMSALAFLWFAVGTALADAGPGCRLRWYSILLFFAALVGADPMVRGAAAWPWLAAPVALVGGGGYLVWLLHTTRARAKAIATDYDLGPEYGPQPAKTSFFEPRHERLWSLPRMGTSIARWIRAAVYEPRGRGLPFRIGTIVVVVLGIGGFLATMGYWDGLGVDGTARSAWASVHGMLVHPRSEMLPGSSPPHLIIAILVWLLVFGGWDVFALRRGTVYPLARKHRAQILFWGGAIQSLIILVATGIAFALVAEVARRYGGLEDRGPGLPRFVRILILALILHPVVAGFHLRFLSQISIHEQPLVGAGVIMLGGLVGGYLIGGFTEVWFALESDVSPVLLAAGAVLLLVAAQLAHRAWLDRHFARCDLV